MSDGRPMIVLFDRTPHEEDRKMPYITTGEQIGYDRGIKEGRAEEAKQALERQQSLVFRQLNRKIGCSSDLITTLSIAQLEALGEALLDFDSLAKPPEGNRRSRSLALPTQVADRPSFHSSNHTDSRDAI